MVFSGHEHLYERVSRGGIQYVVTGGGGAPGDPDHWVREDWNYDGTTGAAREQWCDYKRRPDDWRHYCLVAVSRQDCEVGLRVYSCKGNLIDRWPAEE